MLPEELTEDNLRAVGIENIPTAMGSTRNLAGQGITDDDLEPLLPLLLNALKSSPDPDRALDSFARWFAAIGGRYAYLQSLVRHPLSLDIFCLVTGCSQYFADLLVRQPEYFEIISSPGVRGGHKTSAALYRDASALVDICIRPELKRDALRRWKAREMLRIGVRDLIGLADMPVTAREFSNLADACVQKALDIAFAMHPLAPDSQSLNQSPPFCIIAMGKLGGQELNYSSDIDLMFVHGDDLPSEVTLESGRKIEGTTYILRIAEAIVKILAEETANAHVFRVDMRLRPEGRFGPLSRSLSGFRHYYESWSEGWERQALIKARVVAGDRQLGKLFTELATGHVYRKHVSEEFITEIRANKRRIEKKCELEGETETNVKTGFGGIRDVEFSVQMLQIIFGGSRPFLWTPSTLTALQRLHHANLLSDTETAELSDDYIFLRNLEHRLQLLHSFQTQNLPSRSDTRERLLVARRMGFSQCDTFESELSRRRERVHGHLQRLFYQSTEEEPTRTERGDKLWAELPALLDLIETSTAQERLRDLLLRAGFRDTEAAVRSLHLPMHGNEFGEMPPDTPIAFQKIAISLMNMLSRSPDPDAGLAGIESLALAVPNRANLYVSFQESPETLRKLVSLASSAPPLMKQLVRHQEWLEGLLSPEEEELEDARTLAEATRRYTEMFQERLILAKIQSAKLDAIARIYQREILHIGAREVWGETEVSDTMRELSALAQATLQQLLEFCTEAIAASHPDPDFARLATQGVAIIGLGKLGGAEPGYSSDWDVVFVYDEEAQHGEGARSAEGYDLVNTLVQQMLSGGKEMVSRGAKIEIDIRLRPWGKKGALIQTLKGYEEYYRESGETWERQAVLKARFVAGNPRVGDRFVALLHAVSYGQGLSAEQSKAIVEMKQRIETERLKPEEQHTDLKLGHGGLTDIEWLAQRLEFQFGKELKELRVPGTVESLAALARVGVLDGAEANVLTSAYLLLSRLRNNLWLHSGAGQDILPSDPVRLQTLARQMGYLGASAGERLREEVEGYMQEVRRIFQYRFPA